ANNCTEIVSFNLSQPSSLTVNVDQLEDVSCNGGSDGLIVISVSGNVGTVNYNWSNGLSPSTTQNNLSARTYSVTVTDNANGCTQVVSIPVNEPAPLTANINTTPESCVPGRDGTISVNASGGTVVSNYNFNWSNGLPSTSTQVGLRAGSYTVTISDDNGCSLVRTVNVGSVAPFNVDTVINHVSCNGGNYGSIDLTVSRVTGTAQFTLDK